MVLTIFYVAGSHSRMQRFLHPYQFASNHHQNAAILSLGWVKLPKVLLHYRLGLLDYSSKYILYL